MKILFVCHEPLPAASTSTEQLMHAAGAMAGLGEHVVVSVPVDSDETRDELTRRVSEYYGIPASRFGAGLELAPIPRPRSAQGILARPWHDIRAARAADRGDYDLVYVRDPLPLVAALLTDKPVVFETYRYDFNTRLSYASWRAFCYHRRGLLGVVTHSQFTRRSFLDKGLDEEAVLVAYNGYDPPPGPPPDRMEERRLLDLDPLRPVVVYAGDVHPSKGIASILPVAKALPRVQILIVGHEPGSAGVRWLEGEIDSRSLDNVTLVPRVPPASVHRYLAMADCLFIPTASGPLYDAKRTVLPLKTFRYLGAARPIVAARLPDVEEILRDGENALLVPPDDPGKTVEAVQRVLDDESLAGRLARGARETAKAHSWTARARRIRDFLNRRLAAGRYSPSSP